MKRCDWWWNISNSPNLCVGINEVLALMNFYLYSLRFCCSEVILYQQNQAEGTTLCHADFSGRGKGSAIPISNGIQMVGRVHHSSFKATALEVKFSYEPLVRPNAWQHWHIGQALAWRLTSSDAEFGRRVLKLAGSPLNSNTDTFPLQWHLLIPTSTVGRCIVIGLMKQNTLWPTVGSSLHCWFF